MQHSIRSFFLASVAILGFSASLTAHTGDPKERDKQPHYAGVGWTKARGGDVAAMTSFPSSGIELYAWLPVTAFGAQMTSANVVWGHVSPAGSEYAVIGLSHGTAFVRVDDPGSPEIVGFITGPTSLWRDVKVYQNYAYAVSEGGGGIQVIDLTMIDSNMVHLAGSVNTPSGTNANTHTMFIDTASGFLYRAGGGSNGLRIYSLANPASPAFVASWPDRYVHEVTVVTYTSGPYAGKQIAFACGGLNGGQTNTGVDIIDVTNKSNLINLSRFNYPNARFSHQAWPSDDMQFLYHNDELDDSQLGITSLTRVFNISDLSNPTFAGSFTSGTGSVDHNITARGNLLFESNYRSGLRVFDITNRTNPTEVGFFDTWPGDNNPSFNGLWSNYPFLPSGIVLGGDIEKGLFIWHVGAAQLSISYPNGRPDLLPPTGATIRVQIDQLEPGSLTPGSATLHYRTTGPDFTEVPLTAIGKGLFDANFPALPCAMNVQYFISAQTNAGATLRSPSGAPATAFSATVASSEAIPFIDQMETNLGWVVGAPGDNATSGIWVRVNPNGTAAQPEDDHTPDPGVLCWVTGQGTVGGAVGQADVDGGSTTLTSPTMNAIGPAGSIAYLEYHRWYSNNTGSAPNSDSMPISISNNNGATWVLLEDVTENAGAWVRKMFRIDQFVTPTSQMKVRFVARDLGSGSIVEAGVDDVRIVQYACEVPTVGDLNGDGVVGSADLGILLGAWGNPGCGGATPCPADLNSDGAVGSADLGMLLGNWG